MSSDNNAKDGKRSDTNSPINKERRLKIGDEILKILRDNAFNESRLAVSSASQDYWFMENSSTAKLMANMCEKLGKGLDTAIAKVEIARTSSKFDAGPCCKWNRLNDIRRKKSREYANYLLSVEDRNKAECTTEDKKQNRSILGDMRKIGMSMLASKGNISDVWKVDIYFYKPGGLEKQRKLSFMMSEKTRKLQIRSCVRYNSNLQVRCLKFDNGGEYNSRPIKFFVENRIAMLKIVSETPLQFGVTERLSRTFRVESMGIRAKALKMLLEDSVSTTYLIYRIPYVPIGLNILEEEWRGKDTSLAHLKLSGYEESPGVLQESYSEALSSKEFVQWKKAINEEIVSLEKNQTWVKEEQDGKKRYKKHEVDYNEIFSPIVKITTIMLVLSIVAAENLHLDQLDVKTTFLHGDLDEDIYMTQPEGFQSAGKEENPVCKLKKSLYGLKQASRQWYLKFDSFVQRAGLRHDRNQEAEETVVSRIRDEGFRSRKADYRHEHHQR
ncbi:retrovirus-related pol polyprotein from transposon TNT 1-94 [Tanacetum coccineum]